MSMAQARKRYTTAYRKRVDVERDVYLPRRSPRGVLYCPGCGSVYFRRRWTLTPPPEIRDRVEFPDEVRRTLCPGCRKLRERYPFGELRLAGVARGESLELLRLLRNEETGAQAKNPLEKIIRIRVNGDKWVVETTTEKLAQRLGRTLRKARGGRVDYRWSHNNKFVRVYWHRVPAGKGNPQK